MKLFRRYLALFVAGTVAFTSVPVSVVFAESLDDIFTASVEESQELTVADDDASVQLTSGLTASDRSLDEAVIPDADIARPDEDTAQIPDAESGFDEVTAQITVADPEPVKDAGESLAPESDSEDSEYHGYVEPDWVGDPIAVDESLLIEDIDEMVEGEETVFDEDGIMLSTLSIDDIQMYGASIDPISEDTTELPAAYPAAYGSGTPSELSAIDNKLSTRLPATRKQSPYGSCWAHEAIALTEAYQIIKQDKDPRYVDNSERHLAYNTFHTGTNPMGFETNDSAVMNGADEETFLDQGGNAANAAMTLAHWRGVATEAEAPYSTIGSDSWTNNEFLSTSGRLENCYVINVHENRSMVKRFVQEYGGVGISYFTESGISDVTTAGYYNSEKNAYYCYEQKTANHGVVIVGWDDDFPASAFATTPTEGNGAWLVRNSWNIDGTVAHKKYAEYFWMSYYDKGLTEKAYVYKMQDGSKQSEHNYFYDTQSHGSGTLPASDGLGLEAANVFKVSGGADFESLDSVTIQTFYSEGAYYPDYKVEVYAELQNTSNPVSGTLVGSKEGELPFLGLYTIYFDSPITLAKDTYFSVVVTVDDGKRTVDMEANLTYQGLQETYTSSSLSGQSFYRVVQEGHNYAWNDVNNQTYKDSTQKYGNFCIGAQTSDIDKAKCTIAAYSRTVDSSDSVADVSVASTAGGGNTFVGDEVTVTAPDKTSYGFKFVGWYEATEVTDDKVTAYGETPLSQNMKYTFVATGNLDVVAVYNGADTANLVLDFKNGASCSVGGQGNYSTKTRFESAKVGCTYRLAAANSDKVLQWENGCGKVIGRGAYVDITIIGNTEVRLVYKVEPTGSNPAPAYLQFVSDSGQTLSFSAISSGDSISFPVQPTKVGYSFDKWVFEGTDDEATEDAIKSRIVSGEIITVVPTYTKDAGTCTLTINYKSGTSSIRSQVVHDDIDAGTDYEAVAPQINGYTFECWKNAAGTIIGYKRSIYIPTYQDVELTACYNNSGETVTPQPVITIGDMFKTATTDGKHKVCATVTRSIPEGYTLLEQGAIWTVKEGRVADRYFTLENCIIYTGINKYVGNTDYMNGYLTFNVRVSSDDADYAHIRGYMVLKNNATGNIETFYTEIKYSTYNSAQ